MDSWPKEGPTTSDCIILAAAGNLPAFKTVEISSASATVIVPPEIEVLPPVIAWLTEGAV